METFVSNSIYSLIISGLLFLIYQLTLKNLTFLIINRLYLVFIGIIPLFIFIFPGIQGFSTNPGTLFFVLPEITIQSIHQIESESQHLLLSPILTWTYLLITLVFLLRFIYDCASIYRLFVHSRIIKQGGYTYALHTQPLNPFTFLGIIYLNQDSYPKEDLEIILRHEKAHVMQFHTIDLMIAELMAIFFWFNPIQWILKRETMINHEYLADQMVLEATQIKPIQYQSIILAQSLNVPSSILNQLNNSLTKKRFAMMTKPKSSRIHLLRFTLILPVLYLALLAKANSPVLNQTENISATPEILLLDDTTYTVVETMPLFSNGGEKGLLEYIAKTVKYPENAVKKGATAKVFVQFVVNKKGLIEDAKVIRSSANTLTAEHEAIAYDPKEFEEESLRVVRSLPLFTPGLQDGNPVNVSMILPINFKLD
jgi:TonB family protein